MTVENNRIFGAPARSLTALLAISIIASLSACSVLSDARSTVGGWFGTNKPEPAPLGPNVIRVPVRQAWTTQIGPVGFGLTPAVEAGNRLLLASDDGSVFALDGASGKQIWRASAGGPLSAGVGSNGVLAVVVTRGNDVVAFENGRERWREKVGAQVFTAPLVAGGRVFVMAGDRSLTAFDAESGRQIWTRQGKGEPLVLQHPGVLLAVKNTLVAGLSGRLTGIDPGNGSIRWEAPIASPRGTNDVERLVDLVGRTSRIGDTICTRAFQTAIGCVNADTGERLWTKPSNGFSGIDGDAQRLYGSEANGIVEAWNRTDGKTVWSVDRLKYRRLTAPLVLGRSIVMGDDSGNVFFLSREDGSDVNRLTTDGSSITVNPVAVGNTLVVVTRKGGVFGFVPE
jgi:outer membrane protein assembly factor BamB